MLVRCEWNCRSRFEGNSRASWNNSQAFFARRGLPVKWSSRHVFVVWPTIVAMVGQAAIQLNGVWNNAGLSDKALKKTRLVGRSIHFWELNGTCIKNGPRGVRGSYPAGPDNGTSGQQANTPLGILLYLYTTAYSQPVRTHYSTRTVNKWIISAAYQRFQKLFYWKIQSAFNFHLIFNTLLGIPQFTYNLQLNTKAALLLFCHFVRKGTLKNWLQFLFWFEFLYWIRGLIIYTF